MNFKSNSDLSEFWVVKKVKFKILLTKNKYYFEFKTNNTQKNLL